jgi:gluconokinase
MFVIIMGVSGSGKSTVGELLAAHMGWPFYDGDHFHPPANVAKMAAGTPLDDADRAGWLAILAALIRDGHARGESGVIACSALKESYRAILRVHDITPPPPVTAPTAGKPAATGSPASAHDPASAHGANSAPRVEFVYLKGSFDLIWERMQRRQNHYMKAAMLQSQFAALEEPQGVLTCDITDPPDAIVAAILAALHLEDLAPPPRAA